MVRQILIKYYDIGEAYVSWIDNGDKGMLYDDYNCWESVLFLLKDINHNGENV